MILPAPAGMQLFDEDIVLQTEPYAVMAPASPEQAAQIFRFAIENSYKVLLFGKGSSFNKDFNLLRENVIGVTTAKLNQLHLHSGTSVKVGSGAKLSSVFFDMPGVASKTVGGLLCGEHGYDLSRRLWMRVQMIEVVTGQGNILFLPGPAQAANQTSLAARQFAGSKGRCGMITAVQLLAPVPLHAGLLMETMETVSVVGRAESALSRRTPDSLYDPDGLFLW